MWSFINGNIRNTFRPMSGLLIQLEILATELTVGPKPRIYYGWSTGPQHWRRVRRQLFINHDPPGKDTFGR